jgi:hypothetical protein
MTQNIRLYYLYRDSGNYKKFGFKDFSNPLSKTLIEIEQAIRNNLISEEFFYPEKVGIQKFRFHRFGDDYSWYEFEKVELVDSGKRKQTIDEFIEFLKENK